MNSLYQTNYLDNYYKQLLEINTGIGLINSMPSVFHFDSSLKLQRRRSEEKEIEEKDPRDVIQAIEHLCQRILQTDPMKISKEQWMKIFKNAKKYISAHPVCDKERFIQSTVKPVSNSLHLKSDGHCIIEILRKGFENNTEEELIFRRKFASYVQAEEKAIRYLPLLQRMLYLEFLMIELMRKQCPQFTREYDNYDLSTKRITPVYKILWKDIPLETPESVSLAMTIQKSTKIKTLLSSLALYETSDNEETKNVLHMHRLCLLLNLLQKLLYETNDMYLDWTKAMERHRLFSDEKEFESPLRFSIDAYYEKDGEPIENALDLIKEEFKKSSSILESYKKKEKYIDALKFQIYEQSQKRDSTSTETRNEKSQSESTFTIIEDESAPCDYELSDFSTSVTPLLDSHEIEHFFNEILLNQITTIKDSTDLYQKLDFLIHKFAIECVVQPSDEGADYLSDLDQNLENLDPKTLKNLLEKFHNEAISVARSLSGSSYTSALLKLKTEISEQTNASAILKQFTQKKTNKNTSRSSKDLKTHVENCKVLKNLLETENEIDLRLIYKTIKKICAYERNPHFLSFHLNYQMYVNVKKALDVHENQNTDDTSKEEDLLCNSFISQLSLRGNNPKPKTLVKRKQRSRKRPHFKKDESLENEMETKRPVISQMQTRNLRAFQIPLHQLLSSKEIICDERISDWFEKGTPALGQDSYRKLSPLEQKEQKLFHRYPIEVTKISLMKGIKSLWRDEDPHYLTVGQIERYKPGKEVTYQGVFTDCFDGRNSKRLYHHYFVKRSYSKSLEDSFNKLIFQPTEELQLAQNATASKETQNIAKKKTRPVIEQRPGIVIVDDKVKQIRYTLLISSDENRN